MQRQGAAHAGTDLLRLRAGDPQPLLAAHPPQQSVGLQFTNGLANGGAVDPKLARQIRLRGQRIAGAQSAGDDALFDDVRDLAVGRMVVERREQVRH